MGVVARPENESESEHDPQTEEAARERATREPARRELGVQKWGDRTNTFGNALNAARHEVWHTTPADILTLLPQKGECPPFPLLFDSLTNMNTLINFGDSTALRDTVRNLLVVMPPLTVNKGATAGVQASTSATSYLGVSEGPGTVECSFTISPTQDGGEAREVTEQDVEYLRAEWVGKCLGESFPHLECARLHYSTREPVHYGPRLGLASLFCLSLAKATKERLGDTGEHTLHTIGLHTSFVLPLSTAAEGYGNGRMKPDSQTGLSPVNTEGLMDVTMCLSKLPSVQKVPMRMVLSQRLPHAVSLPRLLNGRTPVPLPATYAVFAAGLAQVATEADVTESMGGVSMETIAWPSDLMPEF
ncbi:hypothetical protein KIPB_000297 [Kipferlia bialata]|uniref:Uncharacterized protein n=1 Tax=Kipferlia bialata TaxID=797122 RepID=A0A9K3CNY8_9EUKA|nr:hypothetical protein KIPB_000297 [Kipferlia bialata]|eukprot:g297.t1